MKLYADRHCTQGEFNTGDRVYLCIQPYRQTSVAATKNFKLSPKYYGPYQVEARIGKTDYCLRLPPSAKIHHVFLVSLLKLKLGQHILPSPDLPPTIVGIEFQWLPESVLDRRLIKQNNSPIVQWLIKWVGLPKTDAT